MKNSASVYATKMWLLGMPITIVMDDYLPVEKQDNHLTHYAKVAPDGALWGPLLEKSFAKYLGMYEAIISGSGGYGVEALVGSPYYTIIHKKLINEDMSESLWEDLVRRNKDKYIITCGSYVGTNPTGMGKNHDGMESNEDGLPYNHAFSILDVLTVRDSNNREHRLI